MKIINVTSVTVSPTSLHLNLNGYAFVTATVCPSDTTYQNVTWISSNTNVATVNSSSGLVTAKAVGNATIIAMATDGSHCCGTCALTVSTLNSTREHRYFCSDVLRNFFRRLQSYFSN